MLRGDTSHGGGVTNKTDRVHTSIHSIKRFVEESGTVLSAKDIPTGQESRQYPALYTGGHTE